jgi:hypothetical protein
MCRASESSFARRVVGSAATVAMTFPPEWQGTGGQAGFPWMMANRASEGAIRAGFAESERILIY